MALDSEGLCVPVERPCGLACIHAGRRAVLASRAPGASRVDPDLHYLGAIPWFCMPQADAPGNIVTGWPCVGGDHPLIMHGGQYAHVVGVDTRFLDMGLTTLKVLCPEPGCEEWNVFDLLKPGSPPTRNEG